MRRRAGFLEGAANLAGRSILVLAVCVQGVCCD